MAEIRTSWLDGSIHRMAAGAKALLAGFFIACVPLGQAQSVSQPQPVAQQASLPTAEALYEKHIEAIGGAEAMRSHHSREMQGLITMERSGRSGWVKVVGAEPDRMWMSVEIPGVATWKTYADGGKAWIEDNTGVKAFEGLDLTLVLEDATFNRELFYKEMFAEIKTTGRVTFHGHEAYVVEAVSKAGVKSNRFFDVQSGLFLGWKFKRPDRPDEPEMDVIFEKYEEAQGVLLPMEIIQRVNDGETTISFRRVKINLEDLPSFVPMNLPAARPDQEKSEGD